MILISDEDYEGLQKSGISQFSEVISKLENNEVLDSAAFEVPRNYLFLVCQFALIGSMEYSNLYSIVSDLITDLERLKFFKEVRTKEEVYDFIVKH